MQTNIITYLCFITICGLLVTDMWLSTNILLQIVCIVLALLVVVLVTYIAFKHHKGTYTTKEQQSNYQSVISHNVELTNELNHIKSKQATTKQNGSELQTLVLINRRLTHQISNLKTHLQTVSEQLQNAKNSKQTAVVPITPNEQKQTSNHVKKSKTA
jgi:membrane glycosyltransferase